ncbi:adenosylmethionine--8-amino-7-oxononanoate transaminase [Govanella unica]|uniref:Adenosylmethionine-8-amino-7-oxononanoate aminotransferase n=1 Tax=Govanella unica TaxID=2975056 RepID=A0A9X3Z621_9PROT|nr:adenosylmethionine--8-amino-7-oxononanoate transaminase [Govania unica]MDA5192484.1 adenosylmethionine--8-amino-7-oxononanoate transaminase [Govania unica]
MAEPDWLEDAARHLWLPYAQMQTAPAPLPAVRTEGSVIHLADGRELVDGVASWWTACHGYNHPDLLTAVETQLWRMPHVMLGGLVHEPAARLAARLAKLLPGDLDHVFFVDSGSVAVEVALKMALQYWINKGVAGKRRFLSFRFGYHGDTSGAMAVCDPDEGMHSLFAGYVTPQLITDLPRGAEAQAAFETFLAAHKHELAAVVMEPLIQGAGGMKFHDPADLRAIAEAARRQDVLLIVDEIFTGFGRTGSMFAIDQASIVPDIVTVGKALTGGILTLAAAVARGPVYEAFLGDDPGRALMHGPTFMGNALACAAANASLDLFEREPRLAEVAAIADQLTRELEPCHSLPGVTDVRVRGAVGVVEMAQMADPARLRQRFADLGVWIRPFGNIIYLAPAFTIRPAQLSRLTTAIHDVIKDSRP